MRTRVQLLVRKIWFSDFSWKELEDYVGVRKSTLIEELKEYKFPSDDSSDTRP